MTDRMRQLTARKVERRRQLAALPVGEKLRMLAFLLPLAERIELTRYLTALETEDELRVLVSQRMRSMNAGRSISLEAFKEKHEQLESEGR